jgi:cytochrome b subunit of formate dehydrogenase
MHDASIVFRANLGTPKCVVVAIIVAIVVLSASGLMIEVEISYIIQYVRTLK